jgi:hypothetical protein
MAGATPTKPPFAVSPLWWRRGDGLRLAVALLVCVLLGCALTWGLPSAGVPLRTGPLAWRQGGDVSLAAAPDPTTISYGSALGSRSNPMRVGDRFTYGMDVLRMPPHSRDTAVVTKVEPVGLDRGVRYLGAMLGGPRRGETWQVIRTWPPRAGRLHDPVPLGTPITQTAAEKGTELYLGLQITRPGYYVSDGWQITYQVSGRTYRYIVPAQVVICTPQVLNQGGNCPWPQDR